MRAPRWPLVLVQLYDDKAPAAAEEVANYEGELSRLRLEMGERFREMRDRLGRAGADVRLLKWMMRGFVLAFQAHFFLQFRQVRPS